MGERSLKVPRQACRRICAYDRPLVDDLVFHSAKAIEPFIGLRNRSVEKLIVIPLCLLQHTCAGLEAVEERAKPFPFFAPAALFNIEREAGDAGLIPIGVPIHTVIATHRGASFRRTLLAALTSTWNRPDIRLRLAFVFRRVTRQAARPRHRCPAQ